MKLKDVIKDIIKRIKTLKEQLEEEEKDNREMGHYEDCGSFYSEQVVDTKARIDELIRLKIRTEKYRKKVRSN